MKKRTHFTPPLPPADPSGPQHYTSIPPCDTPIPKMALHTPRQVVSDIHLNSHPMRSSQRHLLRHASKAPGRETEPLIMNNPVVLIGDSEECLLELLTETVSEALGETCAPTILSASRIDRLLSLAGRHDIDLFVLTLNNLVFPDGNMPPEARFRQALDCLSRLKTGFQKPIVALAGWMPDSVHVERVLSAGADRFLALPFNIDEFRHAIRSCLLQPR